jgi:predicted O-linked N-acetylglucosamine transferase (SPINDLY family)/glycosyltransferase involved in cell wall biosynthesis
MEAIELYQEALNIDWDFPQAHQNLAILYDSFGRFDLSRKHHNLCYEIARKISLPLSYQITAKLNLISNEIKFHAAEIFLQIPQWIEDCEALRHQYTNELSVSEEQSSGEHPEENIELLFTLGLLYQQSGQYYKAIKLYEKIVNIDYNHLLSWLNIGNYFFVIRDYTQAIYYYETAYNVSIDLLKEKMSLQEKPDPLDFSFRSNYHQIISITNNLGQSYREIGDLRKSLSILQLGYYYSKLLSYMNEKITVKDNSSDSSSESLESTSSSFLSKSRIETRRRKVSTNNLYLLILMYTVKGLMNDWKEIEYLEEFIFQEIVYFRQEINEKYIETQNFSTQEPKAFFISPTNLNDQGSALFDPYSLSLFKYLSSELDFFICQQNCPMITPTTAASTGDTTEYGKSKVSSLSIFNSTEYRERKNDLLVELNERNHFSSEESSFHPFSDGLSKTGSAIRIGYLSYDWRDHPMGRLTAGIVTSTEAKQRNIEIYCFGYGYNDVSELRKYITAHCHRYIDLWDNKNDYSIAQTIASQQIDILLDITSHTYNNRMKILSFKPTGILINYLGFPGTTGCRRNHYFQLNKEGKLNSEEVGLLLIQYPIANEYDYTIVDRFISPPDYLIQKKRKFSFERKQQLLQQTEQSSVSNADDSSLYYSVFSEKLIYLPFSYQSNYMPMTVFGGTQQKKERTTKNICVLNANKKFEPVFFHALTNFLQSSPSSLYHLYFLDLTKQAQEEIIKQLAFYGVYYPFPPSFDESTPETSAKSSRIHFLLREKWKLHLIRVQNICDLVLDTFVYGAHTTSTDVLWMGVPIITLRGFGLSHGIRMPSRVASSLIENLDEVPGIEKKNKLSLLLTHDAVKGYEDSLRRILGITRKQKKCTPEVRSLVAPVDRIQKRIIQLSCISPSFSKQLMNQVFICKYQFLYEQNLLQNYLFNDDSQRPLLESDRHTNLRKRKYHYIMPTSSFISISYNSSYCLEETIETFSSQNGESEIFGIANSTGFHGGLQSVTELQAWRQRLDTTPLTVLSKEQEASLLRFKPYLNYFVNHQFVKKLNISRLPDLEEEQKENAFCENIIQWITTSAKTSKQSQEQLFSDYVVPFLTNGMNNMQLNLSHTESLWLHNCLLHYFVDSTFNVSNGVPDQSIPFNEVTVVVLNQVLDLSQSAYQDMISDYYELQPISENIHTKLNENGHCLREEIIHSLKEIDWELLVTSLQAEEMKGSVHNEYKGYYQMILLRFFSCLHGNIFVPSLSISSSDEDKLSFSSSFQLVKLKDSNHSGKEAIGNYRNQLLSSLKAFASGLEKLPTSSHRSYSSSLLCVWMNLLRNYFFISLQYHFLHLTDFQSLMEFGILWNSITLPIAAIREESLFYGYFIQSIGNTLNFLQKRLSFQSTARSSRQDDHSLRQKQSEKEIPIQSSLADNPTVVIYCYEYGQEWWPGWGPSSLPKNFHHPEIPLEFVNNERRSVTENDLKLPEEETNLQEQQSEGKAMGGSEEAVAYLSYELAKEGFNVEIYSDLPLEERFFTSYQFHPKQDEQRKLGKVTWLHYLDYDPIREFDYFISWRYSLSLSLSFFNGKGKSFLWAHDLLPVEALPPVDLFLGSNELQGIFVQSSFHQEWLKKEYEKLLPSLSLANSGEKEQFRSFLERHLLILPNGIHENPFIPVILSSSESESSPLPLKNDNNVFIYASAPSRGLELVLLLWNFLRSYYPEIKLFVYYGFTQTVIDRLTQQMTPEKFQPWYEHMQRLLNQTNVFYFGSVSHRELYQSMSQAGFLLYPSSFPETGCITMMKAMISGVIPITSHYHPSVLKDLGEEFDFGPAAYLEGEEEEKEEAMISVHPILNNSFHRLTDKILYNVTAYNRWVREDYALSVVEAIEFAQEHPKKLNEIRLQMIDRMKERYLWKNSVKRLSNKYF